MDVGVVEVWPVEKGVAVVLAAHVVVAVAYRVVGSGRSSRPIQSLLGRRT